MSRACAQRLLQPLRRVALEEAVPACAPSCSYATEAASQAETTYQPIRTMDINEYKAALVLYNRERAKWQREVSALRRQWLQEFHEQRRQQQEQKALQRRKRQEDMDRKAAEHRSTAQSAVLLHEIRQAELELQIAQERLETAQREEERRQHMKQLHEYRMLLVAEQSKTWVTPDALAQRIEQALDSPRPLGEVPTSWLEQDEEEEGLWQQ